MVTHDGSLELSSDIYAMTNLPIGHCDASWYVHIREPTVAAVCYISRYLNSTKYLARTVLSRSYTRYSAWPYCKN